MPANPCRRESSVREVPSINSPLVSIGMPTYNGERYIREALDSLLAQSYPNLEILVSDNGSTDATPTILREYGARDPRVRIVRQDTNVGAPENFNFVFRETTGPFFMWAADDDRWEPEYVTACLEALEAAPQAVLACTQLDFMDADGRPLSLDRSQYDNPHLNMASVRKRIQLLLSRAGWYQIYGLMRRERLAQTRLMGNSYGADVVLLVELALRGPMVRVPELLHHFRMFPAGRKDADRGPSHAKLADRDRVLRAPNSQLQEAVSAAIASSGLPLSHRTHAWLGMAKAAFVDDTPLKARIVTESWTRRRIAFEDRDLRAGVKYTVLSGLHSNRTPMRHLRGVIRRGRSGAR